jgi:phage recombination protein Bet
MDIIKYEDDKALVNTVKQTVFDKANNEELVLFFHQCKRLGVHPLDRMIHPVKRQSKDGDKVSFQCSIDYFRSVAEESGEYDGQDEPEYEGTTKDGYPELARVRVYRKGIGRPFVGVARWAEYYPGDTIGFMWRKMPHNQLSKCAEALALRKAFPQKLQGLYIDDEMHQADQTDTPPPPTVTRKGENGNGQKPPADEPITPGQLKAIQAALTRLKVPNAQRRAYCAELLQTKPKSSKELTKAEATALLEVLMKQKPEASDDPAEDVITPEDVRTMFEHAGYDDDKMRIQISTILHVTPRKSIEEYNEQELKTVYNWMIENEG